MDAAVQLGRNPVSKHQISLNLEMSRLTRDGTAEPVSRDQILSLERGQGNIHFPCSGDHEQDWQPYPVNPYSCYMCDLAPVRSSAAARPRVAVPGETNLPAQVTTDTT